MKESPKITLSIIVRNEEKYLRGCLESVKDVVGQIVLVDTGSTDNSINIAREFNAQIYHFKWINDFSAARNFALGKSEGNWILYLDADERLAGNSVNELKNIARREELLGCRCLVKSINEFNGKHNFMKYTRLFRNSPNIKFTGKIHEQIDDSLMDNGYIIEDAPVEIIHIGYNLPGEALKEKAGRNLKILKEEFEKNKSAYNAWQLANTYSALEDHETANQYYRLAVKDENLNKAYKAFAFMHLSDFEYKKHNLDNAVELLMKALENDSSAPLLNLFASEIFFRINQAEKSLECCKKALEQNKRILSSEYHSFFAVATSSPLIISKGIYFSFLSSSKGSMEYFLNELKNEEPGFFCLISKLYENRELSKPEIDKLADLINNDNLEMILLLLEKYSDKKLSLKILNQRFDPFKTSPKFLKTLGLIHLEMNSLTEAEQFFTDSLLLEEKDPSSVFFLLSLYVQENRFDKIPSLLAMAENEFGSIPEFKSGLKIINEKINQSLRNKVAR